MNDTTNDTTFLVPNHHAHFEGLSGFRGWLAARAMSTGRTDAANLAMQQTGLQPGDRVVDIGCGPGVAARLSAERGALVTAIDPEPLMLRVARKADKRLAVTWRQAGAESLPVPDRTQDVAWALSSVHHWPDLDGALSEVRRVLVPGGRFLACERQTEPGATGLASHGWTEQQTQTFAEMCAAAGLQDVAITTHDTSRGVVFVVLGHTRP